MTVRVTPASEHEARLWETTLQLERIFRDLQWVIVGAQMVMLLEQEAGRMSGRTTGDVDALIDVRAIANGTQLAAHRLIEAGFQPDAEHPYRFERGSSQVDLLAPDHLGDRANLTLVPPGSATEVPGGTRALGTLRRLDVNIASVGSGQLPVPTLAGALAIKLRAWEARHEQRDVEDLVRLLSLITDIDDVRRNLKAAERAALGRIAPLRDPKDRAWRVTDDPDDARTAFLRLVN